VGHGGKGIEISFIVAAGITTEPGSPLAIENHELSQALWVANGLSRSPVLIRLDVRPVIDGVLQFCLQPRYRSVL
jgi:hypothetical protein